MPPEVVRDVSRPPESVVDALGGESSADLHEAMGRTRAMDPAIGHRAGEPTLCGPAVTARLPEGDNMMVHVAASVAEPGDVLVFEAGTTRAATWGDLATRSAANKGLSGVVSGGNVRDIDAIDDIGFPTFARAVSQIGGVKETPGSVNVPVTVGDVIVEPGDVIVGDRDGVTVVPRDDAEEVLDATREYRGREDEIRGRLDDGESLPEVIGVEEWLAERDVTVQDDATE